MTQVEKNLNSLGTLAKRSLVLLDPTEVDHDDLQPVTRQWMKASSTGMLW